MLANKLKSSFKTGEFWLSAAVVAVLLYFAYRGYSVEQITTKGTEYATSISAYIAGAGAIITTIVFAAKRTYLKYQAIKAEIAIVIATPPEDVPPEVTGE